MVRPSDYSTERRRDYFTELRLVKPEDAWLRQRSRMTPERSVIQSLEVEGCEGLEPRRLPL